MQAPIASNDNIIIDKEFAALIPPLRPDEFALLEANILRDGCREPLTIWANDGHHILIDGHNRHSICGRHGLPFSTSLVDLENRDQAKIWIGEHQLGKRNLTDDQRAIVANDVREARSAIVRSEQAKLARAGKSADVEDESASTSKERTRAAVAKLFCVPESKIRQAQEIQKASPEVADMVLAGKVSLTEGKKLAALEPSARKTAIAAVANGGDVRTAVRGAKKQDYNERITQEKPKPLQGTYRILYADPPWKYVGLNGNDDHGHAEAHYDCLDDIQLANYKPGGGTRLVKDITDKNAVLFMWVTSPMFIRCAPIIKAWGFEYKSSFVWDKVKHNMGHYNSVRHELLLICTKGSCKPDVPKLVDSVQSIERLKHSQKPHEFYKIIEGLYDHGRKLELFSRTTRKGWDMDGNEQSEVTARQAA